jgi:hypothetical protein
LNVDAPLFANAFIKEDGSALRLRNKEKSESTGIAAKTREISQRMTTR